MLARVSSGYKGLICPCITVDLRNETLGQSLKCCRRLKLQRKLVLKTDGEVGVRLVMRHYLSTQDSAEACKQAVSARMPSGRLVDLLGRWVRKQTA